MIEAEENADIQKLVFCETEIRQYGSLGDRDKRRVRRSEVQLRDYTLHTGVKERVCWTEDRVDVGLGMALEVNQLEMIVHKQCRMATERPISLT